MLLLAVQVSPLSLSEVEEAAGGKARGELVLEALRAGEGLVLHWLLEEGQAALPDRLEAEDYQRMVARGQVRRAERREKRRRSSSWPWLSFSGGS